MTTSCVQLPKPRGFAAMPRALQRRLSAIGGERAHKLKRAHEYSHDEAVAAGRKGGKATQAARTPEKRRLAALKANRARLRLRRFRVEEQITADVVLGNIKPLHVENIPYQGEE